MAHFLVLSLLSLATLFPMTVKAEVVGADFNGFTVRHTINIAAPRRAVYDAAVNEVGQWWIDDHTMSGDSSNMTIDPRPLGCFCESFANSAGDAVGVVHMTVTFVNPTVMIRFTGGLGPLGLMGIDGNMTWEFDDSDDGTVVTLNYAVGGYLAGGLDEVAPAVDSVLGEQLSRLQAHFLAESGAE